MGTLIVGLDEDTRSRVLRLWNEYEDANTGTARFVRDMNLIDMCIQGYLYERDGRYRQSAGNEAYTRESAGSFRIDGPYRLLRHARRVRL